MSYLTDYHAQRRHLTRLCRALGLPFRSKAPSAKSRCTTTCSAWLFTVPVLGRIGAIAQTA